MAKKIVCDVCGKECKNSGRYEMVYRCFIRVKKEDICYDCMNHIINIIRKENTTL